MATPHQHSLTAIPEHQPAEGSGSCARKHDQSLAELYYRGFLDDLANSVDSAKLAKFIGEVFTADPRLLSDAQKMSLGHSLAEWAAMQPCDVKTSVWMGLGRCDWVRPMLEVACKLTKERCDALLEIDSDAHAALIAPWLGDRPGKILPLRKWGCQDASEGDSGRGSATRDLKTTWLGSGLQLDVDEP